jgi:hypothetical protein
MAAYLASVYNKNVPNSKWHIELEDEDNVFFNKPGLKVGDKLSFAPHSYIFASLDRKKGYFISSVLQRHWSEASNQQ